VLFDGSRFGHSIADQFNDCLLVSRPGECRSCFAAGAEEDKEPVGGFLVRIPDEGYMFEWEVALFGSPGSLHEGGYFKARCCNRQNSEFIHICQTSLCHFYSVTVINFYSLKSIAIVENDC